MFTGIVQGVGRIENITDSSGIRSFEITFPDGFGDGLEIGASVAVDGVCLTVTKLHTDDRASFDVMAQSLNITTLGSFEQNSAVNVERAAKEGAEIGGHPLSGHIDTTAAVGEVMRMEENYRLRINVAAQWMKYIFPKGYIAVNGASLTIANVDKQIGWFEVWLIPETLRMTTIGNKAVGDQLNIELERDTVVMVDTIRDTLTENLTLLTPVLEELLQQHGVDLKALGQSGKHG